MFENDFIEISRETSLIFNFTFIEVCLKTRAGSFHLSILARVFEGFRVSHTLDKVPCKSDV